MNSAERTRRRDVKTQDREKSISPLDKDQLKRLCLERVRTERSRLMARMRDRRGLEGRQQLSGDAHSGGNTDSPRDKPSVHGRHSLSFAREILHQGLSDLSGGNSNSTTKRRRQHDDHNKNYEQTVPPQVLDYQDFQESLERPGNNSGSARRHDQGEPSDSFLAAIEEENASYLNAYARGQGSARRLPPPGSTMPPAAAVTPMSTDFRSESQGFVDGEGDDACMVDRSREAELTLLQQRQPEATAVDGIESGWGESGMKDYSDEGRLLSPEEYQEMMEYIAEACREEDQRAEAEALEDYYEMTKRLEEEEIEYAISSCPDGGDGDGQDDAVLCPVCKRDYLLQPGPPSTSIVCACGFRLDTGSDRLGLEHFKQQLADTYSQHSASCSADPSFVVEGAPGFDVLWSSCDGCGFARVVL